MKRKLASVVALILIIALNLTACSVPRLKLFEKTVPVESITILNEGGEYDDEWGYIIPMLPDANGELKYQIEYQVGPDNASNKQVAFDYQVVYDSPLVFDDSEPNDDNVSVDKNGLVTFKKGGGMVKVQLTPLDGSDVSATITIAALKLFEESVFVESITILNEGLKYDASGTPYVVIRPDENGEWKYQIEYEVTPDNATNKQVVFSYDTQKNYVTIDENGLVTFTEGGKMVKVHLTPKDGSAVCTEITIVALK